MKNYKAIIYDIDGTILNTLNMNLIPLLQIIKEELNEVWELKDVLKYASSPGLRILEDLGIKDIEKTYVRWVQYVNEYEEGAILYDGFEEVFQRFNDIGLRQAVASAKNREQYDIDMVSQGYDKYIETAVLADDTTLHKPHPDPLLECLRRLELDARQVVYVGDSLYDYQASRSAGIDFAYAKWGSVSDEGIEDPDYIIENPVDLLNLFGKE